MSRTAFALASMAVAIAFAAPAGAEPSDGAFVAAAKSGALLEERLGRLVSEHGSSPGVRVFAQRMVEDYGATKEALEDVARREALPIPVELSAAQQAQVDELSALRGVELDRAYIQLMVEDHAEDVDAFRRKAASGRTAVEDFAARTLPMLEAHLEHAQRVAAELYPAASR
jgi:putative membrane protein